VTDRIGRQLVLLVPLARPPVQGRDLIGLLLHQVCVQNIREQTVVAIPLALVIERHDEQAASLQGCQHRFAILLPWRFGVAKSHGVAQRTTQPIENRGLQQKAPDAFGLALQDLLDQIVHNVPVVSGKSPYKVGNVLSPAH
jgi:hypothetical protein